MKGFRGTFIFTIIVVAACLFSYFEVFKKGNDETEQKEKDSQLFKLKAEEISRVELTKGEVSIVLQKTGDTWNIEKPVADKADQAAVKNFLDTVLREKTSDKVDEGEKINFYTYGLGEPEFRLKLSGSAKDAKGVSSNLAEDVAVGSVRAYDGSTYVRYAEEKKVYLAPAYLSPTLNKKVSEFRNKNIYTTSIVDVDHVKINGTQKVELELGKDSWKMTASQDAPKNANPNSDQVRLYLDQIKNIKGAEIVADDKSDAKKYHLDKPSVTVQIHRVQEPRDFELKISNPNLDKDKNIYMMSTDSSGILKGVQSNLDAVNKSGFDFTDKHLPFTFGSADVGQISVKTVDFNAEIKKVGNAWQNVDASEKREVDTLKADDLLSKFSHLEAKGLSSNKAASLPNKITVLNSSGEQIYTMSWSAPHSDKMKLVDVSTSKQKDYVVLGQDQIDSLGYKSIYKNPDPIQFSGAPPPPKKLKPSGASLDQVIPTQGGGK